MGFDWQFLKYRLNMSAADNEKALRRIGRIASGDIFYTEPETQKKEINRKLSEGLITERKATILMNRANADEKMRLIIENQRKEKKAKSKTEPKKPASTSTKEFEYVEKLKEIKSLREEGVITQEEFRKLKKKIIDSL